MAQSSENYNAFFVLLEAISSFDLRLLDKENDNEDKFTDENLHERGPLPPNESSKKIQLQHLLISNQKKKSIAQKIDSLKDIVQNKDEERGMKTFATLISDLFDSDQKNALIAELKGNTENQESALCQDIQNSIQECSLDNPKLKMPIELYYNESETYLIHKGIQHCRCLLHKFNKQSDRSMIEELRAKNLLELVTTEQISAEKNYFTVLAETYPQSTDEIKFIFKEYPDILLKSSFFINLANKNVEYLHGILLELSKNVDRVILSRACYQSHFNGTTLEQLLQRQNTAKNKEYVDIITRFIKRYN